ncbi:hypothetical protein DRJ54_01030 [Candidatus Acetothermia bacterium]|nr:MAG: hypothetical protein DRJ54_01030 [Candidatus Acetothermia bacterium]
MWVNFSVDGRDYSARAFLLDKDGTLISFDHWLRVMEARARRLQAVLGLSDRETDELLIYMGVCPRTGKALPQGIIHLPRCDAEDKVAGYLSRLGVPQALPLVARVFQEIDQEFPFERYLKPLPGAGGLLEEIKGAGGRVAVVTNDSAAATVRHLAALGWEGLVDVVVGTDLCPAKKPAPDPVLLACRKLGIPPAQGVMVGDSPVDLLAGREAGCRLTIGVLTGLGREEDLAPHADLLLPKLDLLRVG